MKRDPRWALVLALAAFCFTLLMVETATRSFVTPAADSYGSLFGLELPPLELPSYTTPPPAVDRNAWYQGLIVEGKRITIGDLWGFFREDPILGYAPQENMTSLNGWWQSNDLGARARYDVSETRPRGQKRMLVFGDSYAAGSRLPHEEIWSTVLDLENEGLEVVNFGVDGYGVGQSFLRYQLVEDNVEHDIVLLVFVPDASLWRDINTRRDLGGDWKLFWVMPRFIVEGNELKLIKRITEAGTNDDKRRTDATADELRTHLRLYDRFYFRSEYEEPWLIGKSVIYKLLAKAYYEYQRTKLTNSCLDPESEALQVSEEIIEAMRERVRQDGRELVLAFLPTHRELELLERSTTYRDNWDTMILSVCQPDSVCVDLSRNLRKLPKDQLDSGYDGTHYGPRVNQLIAGLIEAHLEREGLLARCDG